MYSEQQAYSEQLRRKAQNDADKWLMRKGYFMNYHDCDPETKKEYIQDFIKPLMRQLANESIKKTPDKSWAIRILQDESSWPSFSVAQARSVLPDYKPTPSMDSTGDMGKAPEISGISSKIGTETPLF